MTRVVERSLSVGLISLAVAMAGACAPPEAPDTRAQDEAAIRQVEKNWSDSINSKDVAKFIANYAPDAVLMAPNAPVASTPEAIRAAATEILSLPGLDMSFVATSIVVAKSGDVGYSYGTYKLSATGPDGKPIQDKGKYVTTWKKQADGAWKATADIINSDLPMTPASPPAPEKKK